MSDKIQSPHIPSVDVLYFVILEGATRPKDLIPQRGENVMQNAKCKIDVAFREAKSRSDWEMGSV